MKRALCVVLLAVLPTPVLADTVLHKERSLYSNIVVKQHGSTICLLFSIRRDQRNQSCIDTDRPKRMVFVYTRMTLAGLLFVDDPKNILVVGLGGGTLPVAFTELFPHTHVDSIEIDPAVTEVARRFFGFRSGPRLEVHTQDARVWSRRAALKDKRYDLIILDAFNGEYIPEHLMTREFLTDIRSLLADGATLIANTFSVSDLYDHESVTYKDVFGSFINFKVPESGNRMIVVPGVELSDDEIDEKAEALNRQLAPYGVPIKRYARVMANQRGRKPDWKTDARILTDQYSPANLLQAN